MTHNAAILDPRGQRTSSGFLQVILKKDVSHHVLADNINDVFLDTGEDVWECAFI